jgi:hypothetical protein
LPRWAARALDHTHALTAYLAVVDAFTETAADDYLQGAHDGLSESGAAFRDGRRSGVAQRRLAELPGMAEPVTCLPYLSREGERLAQALRLSRADFWLAIAGPHMRDAFDRVRGMARSEAVALLRRASLFDLSERTRRVLFMAQLLGERAGDAAAWSVVCSASGNALLSGAFAAMAVLSVLRAEVEPGVAYAAMVMDPQRTVERMLALHRGISIRLIAGELAQLAVTEEEAL